MPLEEGNSNMVEDELKGGEAELGGSYCFGSIHRILAQHYLDAEEVLNMADDESMGVEAGVVG